MVAGSSSCAGGLTLPSPGAPDSDTDLTVLLLGSNSLADTCGRRRRQREGERPSCHPRRALVQLSRAQATDGDSCDIARSLWCHQGGLSVRCFAHSRLTPSLHCPDVALARNFTALSPSTPATRWRLFWSLRPQPSRPVCDAAATHAAPSFPLSQIHHTSRITLQHVPNMGATAAAQASAATWAWLMRRSSAPSCCAHSWPWQQPRGRHNQWALRLSMQRGIHSLCALAAAAILARSCQTMASAATPGDAP